ncbi:hypothetical protein CLNEO_16580 [Anaerotignum neopropionicum]|uniref:Uncharacterized protein n=1 Tax=Anaerotignum neopropionicum TaxID=36847 RepID=A0A136WF40_9FIRM|nr:hypothetical protein [Anaerotignum neopropionicum]KXL53115.1 hypothetical protein CLNEO_16580 [Anaerotignum neopropionicum]
MRELIVFVLGQILGILWALLIIAFYPAIVRRSNYESQKLADRSVSKTAFNKDVLQFEEKTASGGMSVPKGTTQAKVKKEAVQAVGTDSSRNLPGHLPYSQTTILVKKKKE